MPTQTNHSRNQRGFSLIELLVALTLTLTIMGIAVTLLARSLNTRTRENERVDEIADVQRALNVMSREISNAGFNLDNNGIVASDSGRSSIRIRANLNKFDTDPTLDPLSRKFVQDPGEDITYFANEAETTNYLARWDPYQPSGPGLPELRKTVLANRVDSVAFYYFDQKVTYTQDPPNCEIDEPRNAAGNLQAEVTPNNAKYVVIVACISTPEVGVAGEPGFQPESQILLISDVALRNSWLSKY